MLVLIAALPLWERMLSGGISVVDLFVLWANFYGAVLAVIVCRRGALHGNPVGRPLFGATAAIAAFYAVGYLVLIFSEIDVRLWGSVLRGVSIVVWPVVWAGPAWISVRSYREEVAKVEALRTEIES